MNAPALPELPIGYPVLWRDEVTATLYSHYPESERTPERDCLIELPSGDLEDATYSELQALRDREMPVPEPEIEEEALASLPVRTGATMKGGMRTVTIANHAGGVTKTTLVLSAGYELAQAGLKVLVVDMDAQGSLTRWLGVHDARREETIYSVATEDAPLPEPRRVWGMDLIPATKDLTVAEPLTLVTPGAIMRLRRRIDENRGRWDVVLFDCPPSLGALFGLAAVASDSLIVPLPTSNKGIEALDNLMPAVEAYRAYNPALSVKLYVPTMYSARRNGDREVLELLQQQLPTLATPVPERPAVWKDAAKAGKPVGVFAPYSDAAQDAKRVAHEIAAALDIEMPGVLTGKDAEK